MENWLAGKSEKGGRGKIALLQKTMQNVVSRQNRSPRECKRVDLRRKSKTLVNTLSGRGERASCGDAGEERIRYKDNGNDVSRENGDDENVRRRDRE
jgi:hypothetical protein